MQLGWITLVHVLLTWLTGTFLLSLLGRRRLPPGPIPLPVVGNLLSLGTKPNVSLASLARAHGDVMSLQLGAMVTIVVSSAKVAKLVLQTHDAAFSSRTVLDAHTVLGHSKASVILLPPTAKWRALRKICTTNIFSNSRLEASRELRRRKVQQLLDFVQDCCKSGKRVNIGEAAFTTSLNFLTNTLFSLDMADPRSELGRELKHVISVIMEEAGSVNIADLYPVLKFADPLRFRARMAVVMKRMFEIFDDVLDARLKARAENVRVAHDKDVLDALINIAHEEGSDFHLHDIRHLLLDLFGAGTDTTSNTIEWAMTELLRHPSKLHKAQAELREVIGRGNSVDESDSIRLPYLQAVVKESLRLHPPAAFLVPRRVDTDTELCGYTVPKGAQVFVNVWAMGRDERAWEDASSFEPERFMDSNMDYKGRDFGFLPFGAGRRICPGLPLAHRMLHLGVGSLIHEFDWKLEQGLTPEMIDMEENFGFTLQKTKPLLAIPVAI